MSTYVALLLKNHFRYSVFKNAWVSIPGVQTTYAALYKLFIRCTKITVRCKLLSYSLIQILCLFSSCQASFDLLWVSFIMSALSEAMQTSCRHPVMREVAIGQASWTTSICLICLIYHFHVNILHKCGLKMTFLDECCKTVNVSEFFFLSLTGA